MKKYFVILVMVLLMACGCSSKDSTIDLEKASAALDEKYTNMVNMDEGQLFAIYGVDTNEYEEFVIKCSSLNNGNLYAIIKTNDDNKSDAKTQMHNMFKVLESQSNMYSPEAVKMIQNRLETTVGDYYIYFVSDDNQAYYDILKEFIE